MNGYFTLKQFEEIIKYEKDEKKENRITSLFLDKNLGLNSTCFIKVSIFDDLSRGTIEKDKLKVVNIMNKLPNLTPKDISRVEDGAIGSILGMAIGDAMGHRFEFEPCVYNKIELEDMGKGPGGHFGLLPGQWTDDSSMGLCIADSLLQNGGTFDPHDIMHRFLSWWYCGYNNAFRFNDPPRHSVGLGGNISQAIYRYPKDREPYTKAGDSNTSGNGSIMRNAAVPICFYYDINKACDKAKKQSLVTHQGIEASECCALMTHIIVKLLNGEELKDVLEKLGETFKSEIPSINSLANSKQEGNNPDRNWNWKDENFRYSPTREKRNPGYIGSYAMDGLSMSLHVIYTTKSFKDAIIKAVNLKGDSDTVGSIVGQIAGAYYGVKNIPKEWIKEVNKWDNGEIALRGYMLSHLKSGESSVISKK